MSRAEFKKKVIGKKITWYSWEPHEYILVQDVLPGGFISFDESSHSIKGSCYMVTGFNTERGWRFFDDDYNIDNLINIANKGRNAAKELFEKYSNRFKINDEQYIRIKED